MEKLTLNGWETAKYARDFDSPESLIQAIKNKEGLGPNVKNINGKVVIYPYLDPVQIPTVGYGLVIKSLRDPKYVNGISLEEADKILRREVSKTCEKELNN